MTNKHLKILKVNKDKNRDDSYDFYDGWISIGSVTYGPRYPGRKAWKAFITRPGGDNFGTFCKTKEDAFNYICWRYPPVADFPMLRIMDHREEGEKEDEPLSYSLWGGSEPFGIVEQTSFARPWSASVLRYDFEKFFDTLEDACDYINREYVKINQKYIKLVNEGDKR